MNVFTKAKAYQKKHPRTTWQDCIQAVSGKKAVPKKRSAVGAKPAKKATRVKVVKKGNSVRMTIGAIGGYALEKIGREQKALAQLQSKLEALRVAEKAKDIAAAVRRQYTADKKKVENAIAASKALITSLKRSL